jgi:hypothetical protein
MQKIAVACSCCWLLILKRWLATVLGLAESCAASFSALRLLVTDKFLRASGNDRKLIGV